MGPAFLLMAAIVILLVSLMLIVTALCRRHKQLEFKAYLTSGGIALLCPLLVGVGLSLGFIWHDRVIVLVIGLVVIALPIASAVAAVAMLVTAWCRRYDGKVYAPFLISGIALLLYPLALPAATVLDEMIL